MMLKKDSKDATHESGGAMGRATMMPQLSEPSRTKYIFLDSSAKIHSFYTYVLDNPPTGYGFIHPAENLQSSLDTGRKIGAVFGLLPMEIRSFIPYNIVKANLERWKRKPSNASLTYSVGHVIMRNEPWVVDIETYGLLAGCDFRYFKKFGNIVYNALSSKQCKRIICWSDFAKNTVDYRLQGKIARVPPSVPSKKFVKIFSNDDIVRLLFVGSSNIPGQFYVKGGATVLESFSIVKKSYDNVELTVRSDLPLHAMNKYRNDPKIKILNGVLAKKTLERIFLDSDIFVFPSHNSPFTVFLETMSFELPIITTDVDANKEFVVPNKNGLLIKEPERIKRLAWTYRHIKESKIVDLDQAKELAENICILIDNPSYRRRLGLSGRMEIEKGKFSLEARNKKLGGVFDEATSS